MDVGYDMAGPKSCLLLEKLPAELRVFIYEYVFQPQAQQLIFRDVDVEVPKKDFLLTCRQIFREAVTVYQSAYRAFWRETHFVMGIPFRREEKYPQLLASFNVSDLNQITQATVYPSHTGLTYTLLDTRGGWKRTVQNGRSARSRFMYLREGRGSAPDWPLAWPYDNYAATYRFRCDIVRQGFNEEEDMKAACCEPTPKVPMSDQIMKWIL